jgi:DNA polymerase elongation subunit (family B)
MTKRRRLFFDIETSPNIGFFWEAGWKKQIDYSNIIHERKVICICYKWEEEKETHFLTWDRKQCDKSMLQKFIGVANTATELVGHNGDKFDLAWIRTRCLFHKIDMFPTYTTFDTLKISRSKFKFNSNRLNYIAQYLGIGGKIKTDFNLWKDIVLNKDQKAMDKMVKYCQKDVVLLEKVFSRIRSHVPHKSHYGVIFGQDKGSCPECGSDDLIINNRRTTASGVNKIQYICKTCNKIHSKTDK